MDGSPLIQRLLSDNSRSFEEGDGHGSFSSGNRPGQEQLQRVGLDATGKVTVRRRIGEMLEVEEPVLGIRIHRLVEDMRARWAALDERIAALDGEFAEAARTDERTSAC